MGLVASPSRRLVAGVLDAAIVDAAARGLRRIQGSRWDDSALSTKWKRLGVAGCYFVAATAVAGRTGGQAILGLRVVDEFTRRKPGWRAAMIRWVVRLPPQVFMLAILGFSRTRRSLEELEELRQEIAELRRRCDQDDREFGRALNDLLQTRGPAPLTACWLLPAALIVRVVYSSIVKAGVLRPPKRQGIHDRLAHVLVVDDHVDG